MVVTKFGDLGPAVLQLVLVIAGDPFTKGEKIGLRLFSSFSISASSMKVAVGQRLLLWRMYWTVVGQEEAGIKWILHNGSIAHVEDPCCCFLLPGSWSIT